MSTDSNQKSAFFSKLLLRAMRENGFNQQELAEYINKDKSTITRWLAEERTPYTSTIINVANLLGYAVEENDGILQYVKDSGPLAVNEDPANYGPDKLKEIMIQVLKDSDEADKEILGRYFLEVLNRYNRP